MSDYESFVKEATSLMDEYTLTIDVDGLMRGANEALARSKGDAEVETMNTYADGHRPIMNLNEDGSGSFVTLPFPQSKPMTKTDLLELYNLDPAEFKITNLQILSRWAWFRDEQTEDAVTGPCHQYKCSFASLSADEEMWKIPKVVDRVEIDFQNYVDRNSDVTTAVIFPDQQIGFGVYPDGSFYTTHHTEAISTAMSIAATVKPDIIVNVGDVLDLAPWSDKFATPPEQSYSTQASLEATHTMLAMQRAIAQKVGVTQGNHEERILNFIKKHAPEANKLIPAGDEETRPVLSLEHLLQTDALDVAWYGGYGANWWLREDLVVHHGKTLSMTKQSRKPMHVSTISGHIHRAEMQSRTHTGQMGEEIQTVHFSPGTLCRTTGEVPSTGSATTELGQPLRQIEDWQLGVGIVEFTGDLSVPPTWQFIPISPKGDAVFQGLNVSPDPEIVDLLGIHSLDKARRKMSPAT